MAEKNVSNEDFLKYLRRETHSNWFGGKSVSQQKLPKATVSVIQPVTVSLSTIAGEVDKIYTEVFIEHCVFFKCIFQNIHFANFNFLACSFIDCTFIEAHFQKGYFSSVTFENCNYSKSRFTDTHINSCQLLDVEYTNQCTLLRVSSRHCTFAKIKIEKCMLFSIDMDYFISQNKILITGCEVRNSVFANTDLKNLLFEDCILDKNTFSNADISKETFKGIDKNANKNSCNIDFQSVLKSELNPKDLILFGIHNDHAKDYLKDLVTEIKFQSVFISYSFDDRDFAHIVNDQLRRHGVNTFLWERDAPGGKRLKKIMSENIRKHDRLLFIASQHSLQSEACQYELKEAREKQTNEWKDIYYPIHIDNYLFEVRKEDIPRKFREDFWENIEEVKEFHSKDFTKYRIAGSYDMKEFDEEVKKVIKDLKL